SSPSSGTLCSAASSSAPSPRSSTCSCPTGRTDVAGGSRREPVRQEISTADGPLPAFLWLPEGASADAPVPGLVLVQEIFGLSDYIRSRGADLADQGYAVLAPQVFARLGPPVEAVEDDDPDVLGTAMGLVGQVDWELAVRDVLGARD